LKLRQDVFLAELRLDPVYTAMRSAKEARRYEPCQDFRVSSVIFPCCSRTVRSFPTVTKTIQSLGIGEIHSIEATDLFRGKNVPAGNIARGVRAELLFESGNNPAAKSAICASVSVVSPALKT